MSKPRKIRGDATLGGLLDRAKIPKEKQKRCFKISNWENNSGRHKNQYIKEEGREIYKELLNPVF